MGLLPPSWLMRAAIFVSMGIAAALGIWYFAIGPTSIPRGVLRIGFEHVPPVQIRTDSGPTGMAVETVREAAKRAGLRLQWIETSTSSEEALRRGLVDLWPLMIDLPERRKRLHLTQPWLYTSHVILLRSDRTSLGKEFSGRIAVFKIPIHLQLLREAFPKALAVAVPETRQVLQEVCQGTVPAGFLEGRGLLINLSDRPPECGAVTLRVQNLPALVTPLGIGSTFEAAGAADQLRSEIGGMFRDGTLAATLAKYSYGLEDTWATYHLMGAADQARWLAWGVGLMSIVVAVTVWQAASLRQRRRSEGELRESEERFRQMADAAPLLIWTSGPDQGCTFVNKAWLAFTGRALEEELGCGWAANVHPDDLKYCLATYTAAFEAGRAVQLEYRKRRADGEYRWVLGNGVPRSGADGQLRGYVGTCTDITDLKRSRDEDVARQKLESVGRLAGGIAHDFNNLLGAVLAQADLALLELGAGDVPEEPLNSIRSVAMRGAGIVRQLLVYAGKESAISESVDLSRLIEDMLDLLKVVVSKHVMLRIDLGRGLPVVYANPAQLQQLVINLITNASEAIGEQDGVITIRTTHATAGAAGCVQLEISDTGCGITAEAQAKIFDPFFTTKVTGHGLGLPVVQRIVQALGGSVQMETETGRGTTFRILLPSTGEIAPAVLQSGTHPPPQEVNRHMTVLMVEDEAPLRLAVAKMLRQKGFCVVEAADGTEGLRLMREHKGAIAMLLLDMTLPGAPSHEVLAEARRLQPNIKVILTSAYGQNKMESFQGSGIDSFLRKPYYVTDLVSQLQSLLSSQNGPTRNHAQPRAGTHANRAI